MYVDHVYYENWKNIKKALVKFGKVNIFLGENGSGKSAFMSGIGYLINPNSLEASQEDYRMWLEETFRLYGRIIDRQNETLTLGTTFKKTAGRILKIEGDPELYTSSRLIKDKLKKRLNSEISDWSSISSQGNSTAILDSDNAESARKLKQIFGIDRLTEASESFKLDISNLNTELLRVKHEVDVLKEVTYSLKEIPELPDINLIQTEFKLLETKKVRIQEYKEKKDRYDKLLEQYNIYIGSLDKLKTQRKEVLEKIDNLTNNKVVFDESVYDDLYKESLRLSNIKENLIKITKIYNDKKDSYELAKENLNKINSDFNRANDSNKSLIFNEEELNKVIKDIENLRDNKVKLKITLAKLSEDLDLAEKGECPTCHQECKHLNVEEINSKIDEISTELEASNGKIGELNTKRTELENVKKEKDNLFNTINNLSLSLSLQSKNYLEKEKEFKELEKPGSAEDIDNSIKDVEAKLALLKLEKDKYSKYINELEFCNKDLLKFNIYIENLEKDKIDMPTPLSEELDISFDEIRYSEVTRSLNIYEEKVSRRNEILRENEEIQKKIDERNFKLEAKDTRILELQEEISKLTEARKTVDKQITPFVIGESQGVLIKKMNEFMSPIFPHIELGIKEGTASFDFTFSNRRVGFPSKLKVASGFQRQAISLSYRVALTTISGINLFLGDEIDSDSSVKNSLALYRRLMSQNFDQYFIATHKKETIEMLVNEYDAKVFEIVDGRIYHEGELLDGSNYDLKTMEIIK
jgi:DNA repair exonuclease SbcCD ATPase subunit